MIQRKITVGSEIDSYCGRCKMVLNHIVAALVEDQPRRVRCLTCQSEHNHRMPAAKSKKASSGSRKKSSSKKSGSRNTSAVRWSTMMASWDDDAAKAYSIYETFDENDRLTHKKFGKGVVTEQCGPDKIIALFESGEKMLMHGRNRG